MSSAKWTVGSVGELVARIKAGTHEEIWMRNVEVTERHAVVIANSLLENSILEEVWLSDCEIGDGAVLEFARALASPTSNLRFLNLSGNEIRGIGAVALFGALERNEILQSIFLNSNRIGDEGAIAVANMLKHNKTLCEIYLWDNQITNEGAGKIAEALLLNKVLCKCEIDNGDEDETNYIEDKEILRTIKVYCDRNLTISKTKLAHRDSSNYHRTTLVASDLNKV